MFSKFEHPIRRRLRGKVHQMGDFEQKCVFVVKARMSLPFRCSSDRIVTRFVVVGLLAQNDRLDGQEDLSKRRRRGPLLALILTVPRPQKRQTNMSIFVQVRIQAHISRVKLQRRRRVREVGRQRHVEAVEAAVVRRVDGACDGELEGVGSVFVGFDKNVGHESCAEGFDFVEKAAGEDCWLGGSEGEGGVGIDEVGDEAGASLESSRSCGNGMKGRRILAFLVFLINIVIRIIIRT